MIGDFGLANGALEPVGRLRLPLDDEDLLYGHGCYETLKLRDGLLYFPELHAGRLLESARLLGFPHRLSAEGLAAALRDLVAANRLPEANLKLILVGREGRAADWYAFLLPALKPPPEAGESGVDCLLHRGERQFPAAKSLNMLMQTLALREAKRSGAWDALLLDREGRLREGTRTNLFFEDPAEPGALFTPPAALCLAGITRRTFAEAIGAAGVPLVERELRLDELLSRGFSLFVTSTSSLVLPVRGLLAEGAEGGPAAARRLDLPLSPRTGRYREIYASWLEAYAAGRPRDLGEGTAAGRLAGAPPASRDAPAAPTTTTPPEPPAGGGESLAARRAALRLAIADCLRRFPEDAPAAGRILDFLSRAEDPFARATAEGHLTASAFILERGGGRFLMVHHGKLDRWLQPGGHFEGEEGPLAAALREAAEETGLACLPLLGGALFDLDAHEIPARGPVPAHVHYGLRFLLEAPAGAETASEESRDIAWLAPAEAKARNPETSIARPLDRAARIFPGRFR